MKHRNFHTFEARDHLDLGHQLGDCFGHILREYLKEARECERWGRYSETSSLLLSITGKHCPNSIEELQAYAIAAEIPFFDLWTMMVEEELTSTFAERCTTVVANEGRLVAHNEDWDADAMDDICIIQKSVGSTTVLELYYYGCPLGGVALSIHSNGLIQTINSLDHSDWRPGIPKSIIARLFSESGHSSNELEELLELPRCSGFAHNLVDRKGRVTSIECTARHHSLAFPTLPFVHTNHTLSPALVLWDEAQHKKGTNRRYDCAVDMVQSTMSAEETMEMMSDGAQGSPSRIFNRNTIARALVDQKDRQVSFWLRREAEKGWVPYSIDFLF